MSRRPVAVIHLAKERRVFALAAGAAPAARVRDGALLELATADCFSDQIRTPEDRLAAVDWDEINPATGPVLVEGARPGDVLAVRIERIEVEERGVMAASEGFGVLADRLRGTEFRIVPIEDGLATLPGGARVGVRPMIGVIGVAPDGPDVPTGTPGSHGGNMDTAIIAEGATVYLPVFVPGALLAAGDVHAVMGDGEICGTGVEVAARVTLRVTVRRDIVIANPLVETADVIATIASAPTLDEAATLATRDMALLIDERLGLGLVEATMLMSAAGELRVSQVVDPLKTARFSLPRSLVSQLGRPLL